MLRSTVICKIGMVGGVVLMFIGMFIGAHDGELGSLFVVLGIGTTIISILEGGV